MYVWSELCLFWTFATPTRLHHLYTTSATQQLPREASGEASVAARRPLREWRDRWQKLTKRVEKQLKHVPRLKPFQGKTEMLGFLHRLCNPIVTKIQNSALLSSSHWAKLSWNLLDAGSCFGISVIHLAIDLPKNGTTSVEFPMKHQQPPMSTTPQSMSMVFWWILRVTRLKNSGCVNQYRATKPQSCLWNPLARATFPSAGNRLNCSAPRFGLKDVLRFNVAL